MKKGEINFPLIVLGIILIIVLLVGGVLYFVSISSSSKSFNNRQENINSKTQSFDKKGNKVEKGIIDCKRDKNCFVSAGEKCNPAKVIWNVNLSDRGIFTSSDTYMELKGLEGDRCIFYRKIINASVSFSEGNKESMKEEGLSDSYILMLRKQYESMIGLENTCEVESGILFNVLKKWRSGDFSYDESSWDCDNPNFGLN